jgi:hypothetical protein
MRLKRRKFGLPTGWWPLFKDCAQMKRYIVQQETLSSVTMLSSFRKEQSHGENFLWNHFSKISIHTCFFLAIILERKAVYFGASKQ